MKLLHTPNRQKLIVRLGEISSQDISNIPAIKLTNVAFRDPEWDIEIDAIAQ